jgi:hypothetical protein
VFPTPYYALTATFGMLLFPRMRFLPRFYLFNFLSCFGPINGLYAVLMLGIGLQPWQLGIGFGLASLVGLILEVPSGTIADRLSYRTALVLSQAIRVSAYLVLLITPSFEGFVVTMVLLAAKESLLSGTTEAFLFEGLKQEHRESELSASLARLTVINRAALVLATLVGAVLVSFGLGMLLYGTIVFSLAALGSTFALPNARVRARMQKQNTFTVIRLSVRQVLRRPLVAWYILLLGSALGFDLWNYWSVLGQEVGLPPFGQALVMTGVNCAGLLAGIMAARLGRLSTRSVLRWLVLGGVALFVAAWILSPGSLALAFIFLAVQYAGYILIQAKLIPLVSASLRATILSLPAFLGAVMAIITNFGFGICASWLGFQGSFTVAALFFLILIVAFALSAPADRRVGLTSESEILRS